jgi:hypothetical protein
MLFRISMCIEISSRTQEIFRQLLKLNQGRRGLSARAVHIFDLRRKLWRAVTLRPGARPNASDRSFEVLDAGQDVATMAWNKPITFGQGRMFAWQAPVHLGDGRTIIPLSEAREIILGLSEEDQRRPQWQAIAGLLLSAASAGNPDLLSIANARLEVI